MKNGFKFGFLALVISLAVAACGSEQKADSADTTLTDTTIVDTTVVDTTIVDTAVTDTTKL